jgi:hypothetical protein
VACGALGAYDRERVGRLAAATGHELSAVHADERSILMLDRDPVEWRAGGSRGFGWVETDLWRPAPVSGWTDAARRGACGLVLEGRRHFLHSSVSGIGPLYWLEDGNAAYFASRIDPLARAHGRPLTIDWDAWAAIVALRYPLGGRTPFAEIRRLGPFETLRRRFGRARVRRQDWPWAAVEPSAGLEAAAGAVAEALREALRPLPGGLLCPLSGGRDSRMLFSVLAADGRAAAALTVSDDEGETIEEDLAAALAAAAGVPQERLAGRAADYPRDWEQRARLVEHQFVDHAWLVPLAQRLAGAELPSPDGFAIDVLIQSERHFNTPEALDRRRPRRARLALFDALRRYGQAQLALSPPLREPLLERSRELFLAATRRFEGHPSQNVLCTYATRSVRGTACYPTGLLAGSPIVAPGAGDAVACAALSASQDEKDDGRLYAAVFERLAPELGRLPSTTTTPRTGSRLPRRWRSPEAIEAQRRLLADGPLAPHLAPEVLAALDGAAGPEPSPDLRLGMEGVALLHSWWQRYRDILRPVDAAELAGR